MPLLPQISFTLPLLLSRSRSDLLLTFFSLLSRSNLKATTPPLRRSVALLSRYPSHSSSSSLSLKSPSHSSSSSLFSLAQISKPPLRVPPLRRHHSVAPPSPHLLQRRRSVFAAESHGCIPPCNPIPSRLPPRNPNPSRLPPRNPNPTTNRHQTGRDLTPSADTISDLVLFVDRLVRPVPVVEPLA
ncbi:pectinesterase inhibitor 10-like [Vigna umbellata]|uniref:pectinesterase inhibitor 10-like n=1 Tax=Vigna umbellata TaxID=87088 RepID=UPI001F5E91B7|nr:pectinesterase inhibitor 10-like [Vigna umbellata]